MSDQPAETVNCMVCDKPWRKGQSGVRPAPGGKWVCSQQNPCLDRSLAKPAIMDARDNPVPILAARADLEALLWPIASIMQVDRILAAADRYASAAVADRAGLDALLAPARGEAAVAEAYERKDSQ